MPYAVCVDIRSRSNMHNSFFFWTTFSVLWLRFVFFGHKHHRYGSMAAMTTASLIIKMLQASLTSCSWISISSRFFMHAFYVYQLLIEFESLKRGWNWNIYARKTKFETRRSLSFPSIFISNRPQPVNDAIQWYEQHKINIYFRSASHQRIEKEKSQKDFSLKYFCDGSSWLMQTKNLTFNSIHYL